ncbi:MAG: glycosyltransferase [Actinobacteria bacterium]|nr:glycosyltransferase [Actinomycetota bacterium]
MSQPLVSIVTPVLNRASVIGACLGSVAAQDYPNIEHIVVDGGSTDGTLEVIESFARPGFRYVSEPDGGMYEAINKGLAMAKGEILCYLNSDDLYLPYSVTAAVEGLAGADLVYGDLGVIDTGAGRATFYPQFYRRFDLNHYTHLATLAQPTVFWRRSVSERIGPFDAGYRLLGDCDYWIRAGADGARIRHLDEILAIEVEHPGTLRQVHPLKLDEEFARLRMQHTPIVGAPKGALRHALVRRARWRLYQWRFILSAAASEPRRWSRFMSLLREGEVPVRRGGLLWFLLPQILRPADASLLDAGALRRTLDDRMSYDPAA